MNPKYYKDIHKSSQQYINSFLKIGYLENKTCNLYNQSQNSIRIHENLYE